MKCFVFTTLAVLGFSQELPLPSWLESYPGAASANRYTTPAQPEAVVEHYRKLFETAGLPFQPNSDGLGVSIRAAAHECDLLIQIRSRDEGASVNVNCSSKSVSTPTDVVKVMPPQIPADWMAEHRRKVAEMGIHREHHDSPAPPLVWPSWLLNVNGSAVRAESGVDQSKNAILKARYTTNAPMTEIYKYYRELLASREYPTTSTLRTGHTQTGIQQNAFGSIEGSNYPDGAPGAYSVIKVDFDRSVLNGPITVTLRFTTHEYIAKRGY